MNQAVEVSAYDARRPRPPRRVSPRVLTSGRISILAIWAAYFLVPAYWLIVAASKSTGDVYDSQPLWFHNFRLWANLRELVTYQNGLFLRWALNSVIYSGVGALVSTFIAALAGYYLAIFSFRGKEGLFFTVVGSMLIPASALALPLFLMFARANLTSTYWAVLLPSFVSPFSLYLCRLTAEAQIPREIVESARISGASEARIFFAIGWRLMLPGLVTAFLIQFVAIWNNFLLPLVMLQDQNLYPTTVGLDIWTGTANAFPYLKQIVLVGSVVSFIPLVIVFLSLQRFWKTGLVTGAIRT